MITPFTPMAESKAFVKEDFLQGRFELDCKWRTVRLLRALCYPTIYNCTSVMEIYSFKKFRQRSEIHL